MYSHPAKTVRSAAALAAGLVVLATTAISGCTVKETVKTTDQLQSAPGMYGNALNRANDVAGKVQARSAEGINSPKATGANANGE